MEYPRRNAMIGMLICICLGAVQGHTSNLCQGGGGYCDPNWTPLPNMGEALRGYHLIEGDLLNPLSDPGLRSQIFQPTKMLPDGRMALDENITPSETVKCLAQLSTKVFTTSSGYTNFLLETSNKGFDLKVGNEVDVTAGAEKKGVSVGASTTIPPAFTRGWSDSKSTKEFESFFSNKQGSVAVSGATCITQSVTLNQYTFPAFTSGFKQAVYDLSKAQSSIQQLSAFKMFTKNYGTHFSLSTDMGAKLTIIAQFDRSVREESSSKNIKDCSKVTGSRIFGMQVEADSSKCKNDNKKSNSRLDNALEEQKQFTIGSVPSEGLDKWAEQIRSDAKPSPLSYSLTPIHNILDDKMLKLANLTLEGKPVTGIKPWFAKLYLNYCKTMGMKCNVNKGCGIDDTCNVNQFCRPCKRVTDGPCKPKEKGGSYECIPVDYCGTFTPCKNGGICANKHLTSELYRCTCPKAYGGKQCDKVIDHCGLSKPCQNGASCVNKPTTDGYECKCSKGFIGSKCQLIANECDAKKNVCHKNARCFKIGNEIGKEYDCSCKEGYVGNGIHCVDDPCKPSPCHTQAECSYLYNPNARTASRICKCKSTYEGDGTTNCESLVQRIDNLNEQVVSLKKEVGSVSRDLSKRERKVTEWRNKYYAVFTPRCRVVNAGYCGCSHKRGHTLALFAKEYKYSATNAEATARCRRDGANLKFKLQNNFICVLQPKDF